MSVVREEGGGMTCVDASIKWDVSLSAVQRWVRKGLIEGVTRVQGTNKNGGFRYDIPDEAEKPDCEVRARRGSPEEHLRTMKPAEYIALYGGVRSIKTLAEDLGITVREVRRIYDQSARL